MWAPLDSSVHFLLLLFLPPPPLPILLSNDEPRVDSLASLYRARERGSVELSVSESCPESSSRGRGPEQEEGEGDRVVVGGVQGMGDSSRCCSVTFFWPPTLVGDDCSRWPGKEIERSLLSIQVPECIKRIGLFLASDLKSNWRRSFRAGERGKETRHSSDQKKKTWCSPVVPSTSFDNLNLLLSLSTISPPPQFHQHQVEQLDADGLEAAIASRDRPLVIDFFATWCGPCVLMAKELEAVAAELGDKVKIVKVDVDANEAIASSLSIQGLPTLVFVGTEPGKPALRTEGLLPAATIKEIIANEL